MAFKIGFGAPKGGKKPAPKPKALFGDDEDNAPPKDSGTKAEEVGGIRISKFDVPKKKPALLDDDEELPDAPSLKAQPKPGLPVSQYGDLSAQRSHAQTQEKALEVDSAIYDYDAAFDAIHAGDNARKAQRAQEAIERKSRYMDNFLSAAETRKQDLARAKDKQLQREREAEGDTYADKEKFVTEAYKKQQEEIRKAKEIEEEMQAKEEEKRKAMGMQGFYQGVMEDREKRYQETMKAAEEAAKNGKAGTEKEGAEKQKTDAEIAAEMKAQGKDVLLNEEGQILDHRETLSAGLNIIAKPKPANVPRAESKINAQPAWQGKAIGNKQAMRERQTRMMEEQLEKAAKRAADDEAEEQRKLEHASKSRKTDAELGSAKERYLARKKAAEEAKKNGTG